MEFTRVQNGRDEEVAELLRARELREQELLLRISALETSPTLRASDSGEERPERPRSAEQREAALLERISAPKPRNPHHFDTFDGRRNSTSARFVAKNNMRATMTGSDIFSRLKMELLAELGALEGKESAPPRRNSREIELREQLGKERAEREERESELLTRIGALEARPVEPSVSPASATHSISTAF